MAIADLAHIGALRIHHRNGGFRCDRGFGSQAEACPRDVVQSREFAVIMQLLIRPADLQQVGTQAALMVSSARHGNFIGDYTVTAL